MNKFKILIGIVITFLIICFSMMFKKKYLNCSKSEIQEISNVKGRGIFATKNINKGELIEKAPYIEIYNSANIGNLADYTVTHPSSLKKVILGLGNFSLYNHSDENNADYYLSSDGKKYLEVIALEPIKKGEEITINYGEEWWKERPNLEKI